MIPFKRFIYAGLYFSTVVALPFAIVACDVQEDPAEEAREAVEETGDKIEDAAEDAQ